jgi:3-phenylpropionate/trans-cinnamate dioxygenase ferredoxin subunit
MTEYYPAVRLSVIGQGQLCDIEIAGRPVLLVRIGDHVHATSNVCPHAGSPLSHGSLSGAVVQCPLHGIRFRLADGSIVGRAVCDQLPVYKARIREGMIEVAFPDDAPVSP